MSDPSIDILTARLSEVKIDPQTRDALASDLDYASMIPHDADAAMLGVKRLVVSGVRRELLALSREEDIRGEIHGAVEACREAAAKPCAGGGRRSALSFRWGDRSIDMTGPVALVAVIVVAVLGFWWLRQSTRAEIRESVNSAMSLSSLTQPWEINEKETRQ